MTRPVYKARTKTPGDYGNSPQAAALRLQLAGLAALEQTPVYREMCAAATATRRAEDALPRQQNGKLLARALAAPSSVAVPPSAAGGGTGGASGTTGVGEVVGDPAALPTSEAGA